MGGFVISNSSSSRRESWNNSCPHLPWPSAVPLHADGHTIVDHLEQKLCVRRDAEKERFIPDRVCTSLLHGGPSHCAPNANGHKRAGRWMECTQAFSSHYYQFQWYPAAVLSARSKNSYGLFDRRPFRRFTASNVHVPGQCSSNIARYSFGHVIPVQLLLSLAHASTSMGCEAALTA